MTQFFFISTFLLNVEIVQHALSVCIVIFPFSVLCVPVFTESAITFVQFPSMASKRPIALVFANKRKDKTGWFYLDHLLL